MTKNDNFIKFTHQFYNHLVPVYVFNLALFVFRPCNWPIQVIDRSSSYQFLTSFLFSSWFWMCYCYARRTNSRPTWLLHSATSFRHGVATTVRRARTAIDAWTDGQLEVENWALLVAIKSQEDDRQKPPCDLPPIYFLYDFQSPICDKSKFSSLRHGITAIISHLWPAPISLFSSNKKVLPKSQREFHLRPSLISVIVSHIANETLSNHVTSVSNF